MTNIDVFHDCCCCGVKGGSREACYYETSSPSLSLSHVWETRGGQRSHCSTRRSHIWKTCLIWAKVFFLLTWTHAVLAWMILNHTFALYRNERLRVPCQLTSYLEITTLWEYVKANNIYILQTAVTRCVQPFCCEFSSSLSNLVLFFVTTSHTSHAHGQKEINGG